MEKNRVQAIADFKKLFEKLSYSHDYSTTFTSFLDFALWRLAPHCEAHFKEDMLRWEKTYKSDMGPVMGEMFLNWTIACDNDGEGFYDALGDLFMECVSFGRNGQFFTPQPICDMMALVTNGDQLEPGKTVCDPACGSGRMLLAMGRLERRMKFFGSDNDHTCVKMAVLNMLVNSMEGEIAWMDTLSLEHYKSYHIRNILIGTHYIPVLSVTGKNETNFIERLPAAFKEMNTEVNKASELIVAQPETNQMVKKPSKPIQSQLLFDF